MILLISIFFITVYVVWYYMNVRKYPRGPTPLPFIGNILQMPSEDLDLYMDEVSKTYGPVFTLFMPRPAVVFTSYEAIKEALIVKGEHFSGKSEDPPTSVLSMLPNGGIFASNGDNWREQRRLAISIFRDFGMGKGAMEGRMLESVQQMTEHLDLLEDKSAVDLYGPIQYFDFIKSEVKAQADSFQLDAHPSNFVHAYLKEMNTSKNPFLTYEQLENVASDFWLAGMETTSVTLRWAMLYMLAYPKIQEKAHDEIVAVLGHHQLVCMTDKTRLPYINAFVQEVHRFSNIAKAEQHRSTGDAVVCGKFIPADTLIYPQYCSVMANDSVFEEPKKFMPERYLSEDGKIIRKDLLEKSMPFGVGKRACPGEGLARMQIFLTVTTLLQKYKFIANGPVDIKPIPGVLAMPSQYTCQIVARDL